MTDTTPENVFNSNLSTPIHIIGESMVTAVPTIALFPDEKLQESERIEKWTWQLCRSLEQNYTSRYPDSSIPVTFTMSFGKKYIKVIQEDSSVHAFIDRKTGDVYKPASWKAPAKHVRYDLRVITEREECFNRADWAGGYLYIR